jgi:hypothetical protein
VQAWVDSIGLRQCPAGPGVETLAGRLRGNDESIVDGFDVLADGESLLVGRSLLQELLDLFLFESRNTLALRSFRDELLLPPFFLKLRERARPRPRPRLPSPEDVRAAERSKSSSLLASEPNSLAPGSESGRVHTLSDVQKGA